MRELCRFEAHRWQRTSLIGCLAVPVRVQKATEGKDLRNSRSFGLGYRPRSFARGETIQDRRTVLYPTMLGPSGDQGLRLAHQASVFVQRRFGVTIERSRPRVALTGRPVAVAFRQQLPGCTHRRTINGGITTINHFVEYKHSEHFIGTHYFYSGLVCRRCSGTWVHRPSPHVIGWLALKIIKPFQYFVAPRISKASLISHPKNEIRALYYRAGEPMCLALSCFGGSAHSMRRDIRGGTVMPRLPTLQQLFHNDRAFQDFLAQVTGGSPGHDDLKGTESGNMLFAGRGYDDVAGRSGNDVLSGGAGKAICAARAMIGSVAIPAMFGADRMNGGSVCVLPSCAATGSPASSASRERR